jgi:hypothetical protein
VLAADVCAGGGGGGGGVCAELAADVCAGGVVLVVVVGVCAVLVAGCAGGGGGGGVCAGVVVAGVCTGSLLSLGSSMTFSSFMPAIAARSSASAACCPRVVGISYRSLFVAEAMSGSPNLLCFAKH